MNWTPATPSFDCGTRRDSLGRGRGWPGGPRFVRRCRIELGEGFEVAFGMAAGNAAGVFGGGGGVRRRSG